MNFLEDTTQREHIAVKPVSTGRVNKNVRIKKFIDINFY